MNLVECFAAFEGDYNGVISRLITEDRVKKFIRMFVADESFELLVTSLESGDYETAFRAAHTLKGTCSNLGISKLQKSSEAMTEALRGGINNGADELFPQLKADYELTIDAIKQLD